MSEVPAREQNLSLAQRNFPYMIEPQATRAGKRQKVVKKLPLELLHYCRTVQRCKTIQLHKSLSNHFVLGACVTGRRQTDSEPEVGSSVRI